MDRTETLKILMMIEGSMPVQFEKLSKETIELMTRSWTALLEHEDATVVALAVKNFLSVDTKGFIPTVGQIKHHVAKLLYGSLPTEQEAWDEVLDVLGESYYKPLTSFNKLSPTVKKHVGSPSKLKQWSAIDTSSLMTVVESNFKRGYRNTLEKEEQARISAPDFKLFIADREQREALLKLTTRKEQENE